MTETRALKEAFARECDRFDATTNRTEGSADAPPICRAYCRKADLTDYFSPTQAIKNHELVQRYQSERNFYLHLIYDIVETTSTSFVLTPKPTKLIYPSHVGYISERDSVTDNEIVMSGPLSKSTSVRGRFQKKYVVITKGKLSWYNSKEHFEKNQGSAVAPTFFEKFLSPTTTSSPKHLPLDGDFVCRAALGERENLIEIVFGNGQTRYFKTKNELERRKWLDAMRRAQINVVEFNYTNDVTSLSTFRDRITQCDSANAYKECLSQLPDSFKIPSTWMFEKTRMFIPTSSTIISELKKGRIKVNHYSHGTIPSSANSAFTIVNSMYRELHLILPDLPIVDAMRYIRFVFQRTCRPSIIDAVHQFLCSMILNTHFANLAICQQSEVPLVSYQLTTLDGDERGVKIENSIELSFRVYNPFDALNDWLTLTTVYHFDCCPLDGRSGGNVDVFITKLSGLAMPS